MSKAKGVSGLQGELWGGLAAMLVALPSAIAICADAHCGKRRLSEMMSEQRDEEN